MMTEISNPILKFYLPHLKDAREKDGFLEAACPFGHEEIRVDVRPESPFYGLFRCADCFDGGFASEFAGRAGIPEEELARLGLLARGEHVPPVFPRGNENRTVRSLHQRLTTGVREDFLRKGIGEKVLARMQVGWDGRHVIFPYIQEDGNCYSYKKVPAVREQEPFWEGLETFRHPPFDLYNVRDVHRALGGVLVITEGEENLLVLKEHGYLVVALQSVSRAESLTTELMSGLQGMILIFRNDEEGRRRGRELAERLGSRARLARWGPEFEAGYDLVGLARDKGKAFPGAFEEIAQAAQPVSPFFLPKSEFAHVVELIERKKQRIFLGIESPFPRLNDAVDGLRGLNILGAQPKVGKSTFVIHLGTEIARTGLSSVIYYDFENGRKTIYMRTLCRLARLSERELVDPNMGQEAANNYRRALDEFQDVLRGFRVVTDRSLSPQSIRRQIEYLRGETGRSEMMLIFDSLHKLPLESLTDRRSGIDAWLRTLESIRDEEDVTIIAISELGRSASGGYEEKPDMSSFKATGDIEYAADNAYIMTSQIDPYAAQAPESRIVTLWMVASREIIPGKLADYRMLYPYWAFEEVN
ncbi:MAG: AAA family ATPase [Deltaproteobacteria bacterium]|nr:AAA family ATPase [Deltaproteobacteria bacterium]MBW2307207.1 AAA family ATPase [Deltaproteobacteria bacterium]